MKTISLALLSFLALLVVAQSQDPGPSPTASVGCVAHNDHWDCEGPRVDNAAATTPAPAETAPAETTHDEYASVTGSVDPGPSPVESIGCVSHGDHWDCEGPRVDGATTTAPAAAETSHGTTSHDENAAVTGSADPGPSPVNSIGCVAHGDHWDCEGPAPGVPVTSTADTPATSAAAATPETSAASNTSSAPVVEFTGAANFLSLDHSIVAAAAGVLGLGVFFLAV